MKNNKTVRFSKSIIVKGVSFLIVSMLLVVSIGTYFYAKQQTKANLDSNFSTNETQLQQLMSTTINEMDQFSNRLVLLAKTSELQGMDPIVAAGYLKSYSISSLFTSGETISLFDRQNSLICDNSMLGTPKVNYPIDFTKVSPHRPYNTPWYRESDNTPKRAFATVVANHSIGDGFLVASFSFRRMWKNFNEFKVGKKGFVIALNSDGEILFHPDLKKWMNGIHKISEIGFKDFDVKSFEIKEPTFFTLNNETLYLANFTYNPAYDLGLITLQPKIEIDKQVASIKLISWIILISSILFILLEALWLILSLGKPMNKLIEHISKITDGNIDIEEIQVGNRKDEIGQLSKAFNQMHCTIKEQIRELNAHREMLEQEVKERTQELELANKKLDLISRTDDLTGLPNRRDMNETIQNEIGRSARTHKPFCFIFFDIDHFKRVNDTYGHAAGDLILKAVSNTVRNLLRRYDVLARYGGEEFLTLLPETDIEGAAVVAERFRKKIEKMTVKYADFEIKVTITLGVSQFDSNLGADRSIQLADKALYEGKESGRNRIILCDPNSTTEEDYKKAAFEKAHLNRDSN